MGNSTSIGKGRLAVRNIVNLGDLLWARWRMRRPRFLPLLMLFITYRCNLKCTMCGVRFNCTEKSAEDELSFDEYKKILLDARRLNTTLMSISGGEALARGDLPLQIIALGRELGIAAHLCTNGTYLTEDMASRLGESGLLSASVSLESHLEEVHDHLRGKGSYCQAVNAIKLLRKHAPKVKVGINHTITSENYTDIVEIVKLAESLGVHQIKFAPFHTNLLHSQKPSEDFAPLFLSSGQLEELEQELQKVKAVLRHSRLLSNHPYYLDKLVDSFRKPQVFDCYAGYAICTIDPMGKVSPCPDIASDLSVRSQGLYEIWRGNDFQNLRLKACQCGHRCWDPFYTEVSLRLGIKALPQNCWQMCREFLHYY